MANGGFEQHSGLPFQDVHPGGCDLGTFGSACASHHGSHHKKPAGFFGLMVSVMVYTGLQLKAQKKNRRIFPDLFAKNIICLKPEHELLGMGMFEMRKHSETKQLPCKWIKWPSSYPISAALGNWLLWLLSCVLHPLSQHAGDFRHEAFETIAGAVGVVAPVQQNLQQNQLAAEGSPRKYGSKQGNTKHHQTRNTQKICFLGRKSSLAKSGTVVHSPWMLTAKGLANASAVSAQSAAGDADPERCFHRVPPTNARFLGWPYWLHRPGESHPQSAIYAGYP